jgi:hypothetical protein
MRARTALIAVSTVAALGGVLGACGLGDEQADCASSAESAERMVACAQVDDHDHDPDRSDGVATDPVIRFAEADEVTVGTKVVVSDGAQLVVLDGPANGFRPTPAEGTFLAAVPGTYRVVEYERIPCGGPPDEDDARTVTIVREPGAAAGEDAPAARPSGWRGAGRAPAPQC